MKPAASKPARAPAAATPARAPAAAQLARATAAAKPVAPKPAASPALASLLAEILAAPDDHTARLPYADLLIEAGDPRGTFISQQCALATLDELDERYAPMLASTHRLAAAHARTWLACYLDRVEVRGSGGRVPVDRLANARFAGGFLERIAVAPGELARTWADLSAREPIAGVELLAGEFLERPYRGLAEPRAFRVLKVSPDGWFTANSVANVLAWGMPRLRDLDLTGCDVGVTGARLLANLETDLGATFDDHVAPPPFARGQLRSLVLDNAQLGDDGARTLFAAEHLEGLRVLELTRCRIADPETLVALRDAPALRALERLSLAGNNALGEHLGLLAAWEVLPRLTALALPQSTTPAALAALVPRPSAALRRLELASAKALGQAPGLFEVAEALAYLDVGTTSLGDERWRALVRAPSLRRVLHLHANGCSLSDAAIEALTASPLDRLVTLDLSSNKLTDAGLRALAAWPGLQHVTHLRIGNNRKVGAAGLAALANATHLQPAVLDVGKLADAKLAGTLRERFGDALLARA